MNGGTRPAEHTSCQIASSARIVSGATSRDMTREEAEMLRIVLVILGNLLLGGEDALLRGEENLDVGGHLGGAASTQMRFTPATTSMHRS